MSGLVIKLFKGQKIFKGVPFEKFSFSSKGKSQFVFQGKKFSLSVFQVKKFKGIPFEKSISSSKGKNSVCLPREGKNQFVFQAEKKCPLKNPVSVHQIMIYLIFQLINK